MYPIFGLYCHLCKFMEKKEVYVEMKTFQYRFPIVLFDGYKSSNKNDYYLIVISFPFYLKAYFNVDTKKINSKYVEVEFKSSRMVERMLKYNSFMYLSKKRDLQTDKKIKFFNFKNVTLSEPYIRKY